MICRLLAAWLILATAQAAEIHITATKESLIEGRNRVRAELARKRDEALVVHLHGHFEITDALELGPEDSGSPEHPVTWLGHDAVISGGRSIRLTPAENGRTSAQLPATWRFRELFSGNHRMIRARHPDATPLRAIEATADNRTGLRFNPGDLPETGNPAGMELVFLHDWSTSRIAVRDIDHAGHWIHTRDRIGPKAPHYAITHFERNPRFYLEGHAAFLNAKDEWHLDAAGTLTVQGDHREVTAPVAQALLRANGLHDVRFKDIAFRHCAWPLPPGGFAAGQAAFHERRDGSPGNEIRQFVPAALKLEQSRDLRFERCGFSQLGGSGLWIGSRCRDVEVQRCRFEDISGNAVLIGEDRGRRVNGRAWTDSAPEQATRDVRIENTLITRCGQQFFGSVGIWIGMARDTVIRNNEIAQLPYTGISIGWRWDPTPTPCGGHRVERNHIHHVMQVLSDGGGIYTLGRQPGTVLRENLIHDVPLNAGRAESNGMFLDQGTAELLIESNVVFEVERSPFRFHQALENTVRNNRAVVQGETPLIRYNRTDSKLIHQEGNKITQQSVGGRFKARADEHPHRDALEPAQFTLEARFRAERLQGREDDGRSWIVGKNGNEWVDGHYALVIRAEGQAGVYLNIGGGRENQHVVWSPRGRIKAGNWHHVAACYDGEELRLYVDGRASGRANVPGPRLPGDGTFVIGARPDRHTWFTGEIRTVRLFGEAFRESVIRELFRNDNEAVEPGKLIINSDFFTPGTTESPDFKAITEVTGIQPAL